MQDPSTNGQQGFCDLSCSLLIKGTNQSQMKATIIKGTPKGRGPAGSPPRKIESSPSPKAASQQASNKKRKTNPCSGAGASRVCGAFDNRSH